MWSVTSQGPLAGCVADACIAYAVIANAGEPGALCCLLVTGTAPQEPSITLPIVAGAFSLLSCLQVTEEALAHSCPAICCPADLLGASLLAKSPRTCTSLHASRHSGRLPSSLGEAALCLHLQPQPHSLPQVPGQSCAHGSSHSSCRQPGGCHATGGCGHLWCLA